MSVFPKIFHNLMKVALPTLVLAGHVCRARKQINRAKKAAAVGNKLFQSGWRVVGAPRLLNPTRRDANPDAKSKIKSSQGRGTSGAVWARLCSFQC